MVQYRRFAIACAAGFYVKNATGKPRGPMKQSENIGSYGLTRIPQLNMSEGRTWSGEDTQLCCFKVFSAAWHNALLL
jgi:hypothetical protein